MRTGVRARGDESCLNDISLEQVEGLEALGGDGRVVGRAKARNATEAAEERLWMIVGGQGGRGCGEGFGDLFGDFEGEVLGRFSWGIIWGVSLKALYGMVKWEA